VSTAYGAPTGDGFAVLHVANDDDAVLHPTAANDPDRGRVAVLVRPGMRRPDWLTRDLLAALGVDFTVTGRGRNADQNLQLLPVRLAARRITDVLIAGAESLTPSMLTDLMLLAAAARVRLWLVTTPPVTDTLSTALADWCPTAVTVADAADAWPGLITQAAAPQRRRTTAQPSAAVTEAEPWRLPLVDATTLLAACRRLLPAAEAAWVHQRQTAAVADAGRVLDDHGDAATLTEPIAGWLLDRYDIAGTLTQFVTDVRGLQIAALWRGLLLQIDLPALMGTASAAPSAAARTAEVWQRLRAYRLPVRAAACALAAARLGTTAICAVTLADTAADGRTVTVDGRPVAIEPHAAEYVAEQRLLRLASGTPQTAPLLATSTGTAISDKALARLLSEARTELGIIVTSRRVERAAPDGATTLRRWGVTVTRIGPPVPGAPDTSPTTPIPAAAGTAVEPPLLDVELLERRRAELHLSRRDVAKHLGVTTAVVGRLESGVNHGEQPLSLLLRLAELLALDLADLLPRTGGNAPACDAPPDERTTGWEDPAAADAQRVGAALHTLGVLVPLESLAEVLGFDAARLEVAVTALESAAPAAGLRVHRLYNRVSLVAAAGVLPAEELAAVLRYDAARAGLNSTQARLVHDALTRAVQPPAERAGRHMLARSNADKVAAASLVGARILTTDDVGDLALHPDAAASLLVPIGRRAS
jgi:transcriptional regulator with XRE-family HTH domain